MIDKKLVSQFRKVVNAYSKAACVSKEDAVELILPPVMRSIEQKLRDSVMAPSRHVTFDGLGSRKIR